MSASGAHTAIDLATPPGGAHSTSAVAGPCLGSKKHGPRRVGSGLPASRAWAQARRKRPSSSASLTGRSAAVVATRSKRSEASW
jgi:hypothetical protein